MLNYSRLSPPQKYIQYRNYEIDGSDKIYCGADIDVSKAFEKDIDKIICSVAFRRLSSKTQIFYSQTKDDLRTRLTHTLEVAHIAKRMSMQLGLNVNLTEAIALAHDVGHTPFGHVGERTLNKFSNGEDKKQKQSKDYLLISETSKGFKHNLQSVRALVDYCHDLKFSNFTLFGIREHSKLYWKTYDDVSFYDHYDSFCSYEDDDGLYPAWSFEAYIVKWADEIAQRHHDLEDAYHQNIMTCDEIVNLLKPLSSINSNLDAMVKYEQLRDKIVLNKRSYTDYHHSFTDAVSVFTVDTYVNSLLEVISDELNMFCTKNSIYSANDFEKNYLEIKVDEIREMFKFKNAQIYEVDKKIGELLKYNILDSFQVQKMDGKGSYVIRKLVRAYLSNPQQLPNEYINRLIKTEILLRMYANPKACILRNKITSEFPEYKIDDAQQWRDYECREVLRAFVEDKECRSIIYEKLLRIVIDYIAEMTDKYAMNRYAELY